MAGVCHAETMSKRRRVGHILNPPSKADLRGTAFLLFDIVSLEPELFFHRWKLSGLAFWHI